MNLQSQRDLSIAGDVVGRDKISINLTRGLDELPTRYDSRLQNFLEYYLGAKDHAAPFGGRAFKCSPARNRTRHRQVVAVNT